MTDLALSCSCGQIKGVAQGVNPRMGNHLKCYCDDCQAYMAYLEREDCLDDHGGTEIFQLAPSKLKLTQGLENIHCVRLTESGLYRWYAGCCHTPIGNTLKPSVPFVGIPCVFMESNDEAQQAMGPIRAFVQTQHAKNPDESHAKGTGFPWRVTAKIMFKILQWKFTAQGKPSPFFDSADKPVSEPKILRQ